MEFVRKSLYFAVPVFAYSGIRHLVFLPILSRYNTSLFEKIGVLLFAIDIMIYAFGGALSDYYMRVVKGSKPKFHIINLLSKIGLISLSSFFVYFWFLDSFVLSFLLGIYTFAYTLTAINIKIYFNALIFVENYRYIGFRVLPYILSTALCLLEVSKISILYTFVVSLVSSEVAYLCLLRLKIKKDYPPKVITTDKNDLNKKVFFKNILFFVSAYFVTSFVQRGDVIMAEHFLNGYSVSSYIVLISVLSFFCNPIATMSSSSLLSYLNNKLLEWRNVAAKSIFYIFVMSLLIAFFGSLLFKYFLAFMYPSYNFEILAVFLLLFCMIGFLIMKTFVVKYVRTEWIFFSNLAFIFLIAAMFGYRAPEFYLFSIVFLGGRFVLSLSLLIVQYWFDRKV